MYHPAGMTTISTDPCQNGGRNGTAGRQDIQGTDSDTALAKRQEDLLQHNRPNQDDGSLHVLFPVRTDHRPEGITDWMQQRLQMPRNPVQEIGDREETAWWSREIQQTEKQEDVGRSRRTRRRHTG